MIETDNKGRVIETGNIVPIRKSDDELAAQARAELEPHLRTVVEIINSYKAKHGLVVGFNIQQDLSGRMFLPFIQVTRHL